MKRLNILILSVVPSPYQRDLFLALYERDGLDVTVHYLETAAPDSPWKLDGLRSFESVLSGYCFGKGQIRSHVNWNLPDLQQADLVILNTSITDVTTQWLMRGPLRKKRWVFWGEVSKDQKVGWKARVSRWLYRPLASADAIVAIGSRAQEAYRIQWPEGRVFNLPYHIQCPPPKPKISSDACVKFLFCGQMIHRKAVDILLAAFAQVLARGLPARLQLVGREAELSHFMAGIPETVRNQVDYLGFKQPAELPDLFAAADVFVLPSRRDGWGVVVNQAVSAGLPVIASDAVGAARDLVMEGRNGFCVRAGEVQPLADAMIMLAEDSALRAAFGQASLKLADAITPQAGAEKFEGIIREVSA